MKISSSLASERESLSLVRYGAVAAVLRGDLHAVGRVGADHARQAEQPQRVLEGDRRQAHVANSDAVRGLADFGEPSGRTSVTYGP